ncbi:MAG: serine/threonine-protein kinase [Persicimonas sp.]
MSDDGLSLADILGDLRQILELVQQREDSGTPASYDAVQADVADQLHLHILSYIRFLEEQDFLVYDRISDQLTVPDAGRHALQAPESWRDAVTAAFSEHISETDLDAEEMDDLLGGMDDELLDDIAQGFEASAREFGDSEAEALGVNNGAEPAPVGAFDGPGPNAGLHEADDALSQHAPSPNTGAPPPAEPATDDATQHGSQAMNDNGRFQGQSQGGVSIDSNPSTADLYNRVDELGSGGVGTVWRANQLKLDRDIALKEINQVFNVFAGVKRDDIIERFTHVVQGQASLVHPNIVQVLDIETQVEYPFVVTQFAPRGNLRRLIEMEDRPKLSVALKYFMQILSALDTSHQSGIIHGNLKPENVVLDAAGNAMLSDFGLASIVEREGGNSSHVYVGVGTVAYMSPEQFQNPNKATVKSDIYSLGIMFYEMLTGKVPGRRSPMPSSFFPDIPRKLDDIFDRMSMDAEEDRYDSIGDILSDLYEAEEVMSLLDNRSAVLFLRDPIEHGETFAAGVPAAGAPADEEGIGLSESSSSEVGLDESSVSEADEDSEVSEADEDSGVSEADEDEDADEAGEQSEADEDVDEDDVLDKLDKYGDMFEEEEA